MAVSNMWRMSVEEMQLAMLDVIRKYKCGSFKPCKQGCVEPFHCVAGKCRKMKLSKNRKANDLFLRPVFCIP